jgi:hypothetical protein
MERKKKRTMMIADGMVALSRALTEERPVVVEQRVEPWCQVNSCFANLHRKAAEGGGAVCRGWRFVHLPVPGEPDLRFALHHAVWRDPAGLLMDITLLPRGRNGWSGRRGGSCSSRMPGPSPSGWRGSPSGMGCRPGRCP